MKVLVTGICGFAGNTVAVELLRQAPGLDLIGLDNLSRPGSELNRQAWPARGVRLVHGDIRNPSDLEGLPAVDWVVDAAANPSVLALEYAAAFELPVYVNRCGVLAGAGQFGRADQGIFSFWIHSYRRLRPLRFIGFGGTGHQVRDCLHPRDLVPLLLKQMHASGKNGGVVNVGGGADHAMSLAQLTGWCARRFGPHDVGRDPEDRMYDVPW